MQPIGNWPPVLALWLEAVGLMLGLAGIDLRGSTLASRFSRASFIAW